MTKHSPITGAAQHRRAPHPHGEPGASKLSNQFFGTPLANNLRADGEAGGFSPVPSVSPTFSRCPDCDGPFSYRVTDEDTGCSYPVDDGEHYCDGCDAIWSDDALAVSGWALAERSALR